MWSIIIVVQASSLLFPDTMAYCILRSAPRTLSRTTIQPLAAVSAKFRLNGILLSIVNKVLQSLNRSDQMIKGFSLPKWSDMSQEFVDGVCRKTFPRMEDLVEPEAVERYQNGMDMIGHNAPGR